MGWHPLKKVVLLVISQNLDILFRKSLFCLEELDIARNFASSIKKHTHWHDGEYRNISSWRLSKGYRTLIEGWREVRKCRGAEIKEYGMWGMRDEDMGVWDSHQEGNSKLCALNRNNTTRTRCLTKKNLYCLSSYRWWKCRVFMLDNKSEKIFYSLCIVRT